MFKRQNRLSGGRFHSSVFFSTPFFVLKIKENELDLNRFGIVVSKKIDKRAVERNRIKRTLREILVNLNSEIAPGHDMLFIVKTGLKNMIKEQALPEVKSVLKQAGFIK